MERLLEACPGRDALETRDRSILEVLYATGVRLDELARMDVGDVDLLANAAVVVGKGNRERMVHFGAKAADWLTDYVRNRRPELAAGPDRGGSALWLNYRGGRLSRTSINSVVKRWAAAAGLATSGVHPHSLRHTFATGMVEGGADLRLVQELLGHAKVTSTQVYTHITQKEARRSYMQHHPLAKQSRGAKLWVRDIEA